jgi:hypothetical protein
MSLEVRAIAGSETEPTLLGIIEPGTFAPFPDFSDGNWFTICAMCLPDNSGSEVYKLFSPYSQQQERENPLSLDDLTHEIRIAEFGPGESFEFAITTEARRRGRIILTHVLEES